MPQKGKSDLYEEIETLRSRLEETEETLAAIRSGEVDALVVSTSEGNRVYTLKSAETPYRTIIENISEGAVTLARDCTVLYANSRFAGMLGIPLEKIIGSYFQSFLGEDRRYSFPLLLEQGYKKEMKEEVVLITALKAPLPVFLSLSPLPADEVPCVSMVVTDLTESKKAEEAILKAHDELELRVRERTEELKAANNNLRQKIAERKLVEESLRESEERYRSLIELSPDAILVHAGYKFIYLNPAAQKLFGALDADEIVGKPVLDFVHPEDRGVIEESIFRSYNEKSINTLKEIRIVRLDGQAVNVETMGAPITYRGKTAMQVVIRDITEQKRAVEERELLIFQLKAAIEELKGFTYSVSHDLRAPIRHISSYAYLLKENAWPVLNEESRSFLQMVLKASRRMGILVDELLEYSRIGRTALKENMIDLNILIQEAVQDFSEETSGREIRWEIGLLPKVWGDGSLLHFAFVNLIGNALKFTQSRSVASIEIGHREESDEHILFISDNGIGFDMQYYDNLFGIFQRLHTADEIDGTGIGLANVHRIIQRHSGRVWAEGKVNEGAVFYVSLPKEKGKGKWIKQNVS